MRKGSQRGFAHPALLLLAAVIAVIALAGYKVAGNHSALSNTPAPVQTAQTIKTKADLNSAESALNNENIDGDLNPDSLNQDVQSLL